MTRRRGPVPRSSARCWAFWPSWPPIAYFVLLLVSAIFILVTTYSALNSCFRVGDVHDLLPGLLSPLLFWSLLFISLSDSPDVSAPPEVLYSFLLGGPLSVTALYRCGRYDVCVRSTE